MPTKFDWPLMQNNISRSDLDAVIEYLKQDDPKLTHGPLVRAFEAEWSKWLGMKYSIMLNSGASANDLTMLALREMKGSGEVIVPGLTWVSDIASVLHASHKPVFVDIKMDTLGMNPERILDSITPRTKAVFLTYVLGFDALTDDLVNELKRLDIPLIEDVCESHGATHNGRKLGTFGWASNFSFYYAHHMTTIEGGVISTNDPELFEMSRMLRSHGLLREASQDAFQSEYLAQYPDLNSDFIFTVAGHNMRPTEINAIFGLQQIKRLDENIAKRQKNFQSFLTSLDPDVFFTDFQVEGNSNYALTLILRSPDFALRDRIEFALRSNRIEFRRGLSGGGNQLRQPYLRRCIGIPAPETLPNVDHVHHFAWYLGNYPDLEQSNLKTLRIVLESAIIK